MVLVDDYPGSPSKVTFLLPWFVQKTSPSQLFDQNFSHNHEPTYTHNDVEFMHDHNYELSGDNALSKFILRAPLLKRFDMFVGPTGFLCGYKPDYVVPHLNLESLVLHYSSTIVDNPVFFEQFDSSVAGLVSYFPNLKRLSFICFQDVVLVNQRKIFSLPKLPIQFLSPARGVNKLAKLERIDYHIIVDPHQDVTYSNDYAAYFSLIRFLPSLKQLNISKRINVHKL
jgi:hypothetical protein